MMSCQYLSRNFFFLSFLSILFHDLLQRCSLDEFLQSFDYLGLLHICIVIQSKSSQSHPNSKLGLLDVYMLCVLYDSSFLNELQDAPLNLIKKKYIEEALRILTEVFNTLYVFMLNYMLASPKTNNQPK